MAVTAKVICAFVFCLCRLLPSHAAAHIVLQICIESFEPQHKKTGHRGFCPVLLFFLFFPIFSGLPIFSYILIPNPIFFHQIPIFFKMLQIIMKYQGKIMEFWFEMSVLMSLAFIFFLARFARS